MIQTIRIKVETPEEEERTFHYLKKFLFENFRPENIEFEVSGKNETIRYPEKKE